MSTVPLFVYCTVLYFIFLICFDYFNFFYVKHFELITNVYEMCYINKLALPCLTL